MGQNSLETQYQLYCEDDSGQATNGNMTTHISSQYSTLSNKTSDKLTIKKTIGQ